MGFVKILKLFRSGTAKSLTEKIFFDTDCLSAFLWTDQGSIVGKLYPGRIVIPQMVYDELRKVNNSLFLERIDELINANQVEIWDIEVSSEAFPLYLKMTSKPDPGHKTIGKGEAAAMSLARSHQGIVASNNFRDTATYIRELNLDYTTTGDILVEAYEAGIINEQEGNEIWAKMIEANRWIGVATFSAYRESPHKPLNHY